MAARWQRISVRSEKKKRRRRKRVSGKTIMSAHINNRSGNKHLKQRGGAMCIRRIIWKHRDARCAQRRVAWRAAKRLAWRGA